MNYMRLCENDLMKKCIFLYFLLTVSMSKAFNLCYTTNFFSYLGLKWHTPFNDYEDLKRENLTGEAVMNNTKWKKKSTFFLNKIKAAGNLGN